MDTLDLSGCAGKFIVFEGLDGAGKTTQLDYVSNLLRDIDVKHVKTKILGGTLVSQKIREILLSNKEGQTETLSPMSEQLLFLSAYLQTINEIIIPALQRGECVLCDRYIDSMKMYQSDLGLEPILSSCNFPEPNVTLVLNVTVASSKDRLKKRGQQPDQIESLDNLFFEKVRLGYMLLGMQDRKVIIEEDIAENVNKKIVDVLHRLFPLP